MLTRTPLFCLLVLLGCGTPATPPAPVAAPAASASATSLCGSGTDGSPVVARAGDVVVSQVDLDAAIQRLPARARGRYDAVAPRRILATRLVEERLLCRAAEAADLDAAAVAQRAAEEAVAALLVDQAEAAAVTPDKIEAFYASNAARYELAVVDAAHIVLSDEARAKAMIRELRAGADFANLAMEHSTDLRSGPRGGKVGWVSRGRMDAAWLDAAFALEPGQVSEPVKTSFGWHVITVFDKRDTQPLEEVRAGIERKLRGEAAEAAVAKVLGSATVQLQGPLLTAEPAGSDDPTP